VTKEQKPAIGKRMNEVKAAIEGAFNAAKDSTVSAPKVPVFDVTEPGMTMGEDARHVLAKTLDEIVDVLGRMGFNVADRAIPRWSERSARAVASPRPTFPRCLRPGRWRLPTATRSCSRASRSRSRFGLVLPSPLALPHLVLFLRWYGVERMGVDSQFVRLSVVLSQGRSRIVPLLC
jgi:hypothetical protein